MAQIRGDILYNRNVKNAEKGEQKLRQLHIATPITPEEESDNSEDNENQTVTNNGGENSAKSSEDDNENEPITKEDEECWDSIINEWINNIEHENQFDNIDDEIFLSSELGDFELGGRTIHPADDDLAKWPLVSLFVVNLESPTFLDKNNAFTDE